MNKFKRKEIFKIQIYRKHDAIIMPEVISIKTFYTSKRTSFFYISPFLKRTSGLCKKNLSNQLSNSSTNFGLRIKQREFKAKS